MEYILWHTIFLKDLFSYNKIPHTPHLVTENNAKEGERQREILED